MLLKQPETSAILYEEGVIGESTARKWFAKFKNGYFDVDDMPRSRRSFEFDVEHLKALLKEDGLQTSYEIPRKINSDHKMILNYLHSMGVAEKFGVWMLHVLNENCKGKCLQIDSLHLAHHRATDGHKSHLLYRIAKKDEK
ncbi:histone-lysine N-methyltransferase SETMAR-like protein [Trichonephila clavata]|uniref:Histone-lysine N-methyltransferase SETMAR-like protein n=1 Tax=Trichonephila clavata TaxID=2740835 RepID=A0A8X6KCM7_TRICU|nr:histone-lysine N-methyltransferase SETMAR-like protein [Trichonephila clavata]